MREIALESIQTAKRVLTREANLVTIEDVLRAIKECQTASDDLKKLANMMYDDTKEMQSQEPDVAVGK